MINIEFKTLSDQELRELISSAKEELKSRQEAQPQKQVQRVLRQMYMETLGTDRDSTVTRYNGGWAKLECSRNEQHSRNSSGNARKENCRHRQLGVVK